MLGFQRWWDSGGAKSPSAFNITGEGVGGSDFAIIVKRFGQKKDSEFWVLSHSLLC